MTGESFMADLHRRGVTLSIQGDQIRVDAPAGVISETDRDSLRERRTAVLAVLRREQLQAVLAEQVKKVFSRIDQWAVRHGGIDLTAGLMAWLRDVAPDLRSRIASTENDIDEAVLAGVRSRLNVALERWTHEWRSALQGFAGTLSPKKSKGNPSSGVSSARESRSRKTREFGTTRVKEDQ